MENLENGITSVNQKLPDDFKKSYDEEKQKNAERHYILKGYYEEEKRINDERFREQQSQNQRLSDQVQLILDHLRNQTPS